MTRRILFRPEAESELVQAVDWYEARSRGLGTDFLRAVDVALSSLQRRPLLHREIAPGVRRILLRRFPYSLIYRVRDNELLVIACFHGRCDPQFLQNRL